MKVGEIYALLGIDFSQFDRDERTAKRRSEYLGQSLSGIIKNAFSFTLGMGFFEAVKQGFRATVGTMFSFNAQMEQAQIGFTTMLGSARRAQKFLDDLAKFAAKTPFEFPALLDASKRMIAYGFAAEDVLPIMEAVGNATASVGLGAQGIDRIILALGQMRAKGKVSGEEMRQLTETGIPAWEFLAEAMGKSTAEVMKLSERGLIPADQAIKMLVEGMNKRFPSMMSQMENTWDGVTSTIRDVWQMTIGAMTKGLFRGVVSWLQKVRDVATGFYEAFRQGGLQYAIEQTFGARAAASVATLGAALRGLWGIVASVARTISRNWTLIRNLTLGVVWAFLTFRAVNFVLNAVERATHALTLATRLLNGEAIKTSLTTGLLARAIQIYNLQLHLASLAGIAHVGVLQTLRTALYALWHALGPIGWIIMAISAALGIGTAVWSKYNQAVQNAAQKAQMEKMAQQQKEYIDSVNKAAAGTGAQADALGELGKAANKNLQSFDEVHTLMEETASATLGGPTLDAPIATPSLEIEFPEMDFGFDFDFDTAIAEAKTEMGGFWGWLKTSAAETWDSLKTWGSNLWDGVKGGWAGFRDWCVGFWDSLKLAGGQAWETIKSDASALWEGVKSGWSTFKEWAGGLWNSMKVKAAETWEGIRTGAATGWESIKTTVATKWEAFKTGAANTWEQVKTGASNAWQSIKTGAATGWDGIKTVISTKWDSLKTGASNTWTNIKTSASTAWENIKTGASTGWDGIKTVISTKWDSLKTGASTTWNSIKSTISQKWNDLKAEAPTTWESIKTGIATRWDQLKTSAPGTWDNIKSAISTRFGEAKENVLTAAQNMYDKVPKSWDEMRSAIEQLRGKVIGAISGPFESAKETVLSIVDSAKNWGKNLIANIVDGIKAKAAAVKSAVQNVASTIKGWLGFGSPTEEGPGRYADRWAPNLMRMYAKGILDNISMVQSAAGQVARSLMPMTTMPAPAFAGMGAGGGTFGARSGSLADELATALRGVGGIGGNRPIEVTINIDGRRMARALIPALQSEQDRVETNTIIRTK